MSELFKNQFLSSLPESLQKLDDETDGFSMVEQPSMNKAVFIRVVEDGVLPIKAGPDEIDMDRGSIHVFRYNTVRKLIQSGQVQLI